MDEDISRWVMEFLLRHSTSDQLINKILSKLPVSNNNFRFKKTLLLRSIQSEISDGSVTEEILDILKAIEDLDKKEGVGIMSSMKAAYCAVAVECTVKFLGGTIEKQGEYFVAVKRIWRGKIGNLVESELVTEELDQWRDAIEAALWDAEACNKLLDKDAQNGALPVVRTYLGEAWAMMGPTFLELAAAKIANLKELESVGGNDVGENTVAKEKLKGIQKVNVQSKRKHIANHRRARGPIKIIDNEEVGKDEPCSKYDILPTPEVNKVQKALKSSSLELHAIVKDPLPDALLRAEAVVSDMARKNQNHKPSMEMENDMNKGLSNPVVNASVEPVQANEGNMNQPSNHQSNVPKPSLMERNSTAQTYEWDDSIDDSPGGPSNRMNRFHLPSPKRNAVSPLKKHEIAKISGRRKAKRWTLEEEEALRKGVQEFGKGNWKIILKSNPEAFAERTEVDLKDKWRNMMRY